ncbi:MAG: hypothetical protein KGP12_06905 [Actinomycetales bacterium]|nr:hypothetical protein [Actinomycetales bacterium]
MTSPFAQSTGPTDLILGLPVHPLVVHFAVVLLPLAAAALIAIVVVPKWRRPFGWVVLAGLLAGAGASLLAKESGEAFAARVGWPTEHASLGDRLPLVAIVLFVVAAAWFWLQLREAKAGRKRAGILTVIAAIVSCILAVAAIVLTVVVGHTGAAAVWEGRIQDAPAASSGQSAPATPGPAASASGSGTSAASAAPSGTAALTMAEVAKHATAADCWSVVKGTVYDLTSWIDQHPGGVGPIESMCGVDATDAFVAQHGSQRTPNKVLAGFEVGPLVQ